MTMDKPELRKILDILLSLITMVFILILYFTQDVSGAWVTAYAISFTIILILKLIFSPKRKRNSKDSNS